MPRPGRTPRASPALAPQPRASYCYTGRGRPPRRPPPWGAVGKAALQPPMPLLRTGRGGAGPEPLLRLASGTGQVTGSFSGDLGPGDRDATRWVTAARGTAGAGLCRRWLQALHDPAAGTPTPTPSPRPWGSGGSPVGRALGWSRSPPGRSSAPAGRRWMHLPAPSTAAAPRPVLLEGRSCRSQPPRFGGALL